MTITASSSQCICFSYMIFFVRLFFRPYDVFVVFLNETFFLTIKNVVSFTQQSLLGKLLHSLNKAKEYLSDWGGERQTHRQCCTHTSVCACETGRQRSRYVCVQWSWKYLSGLRIKPSVIDGHPFAVVKVESDWHMKSVYTGKAGHRTGLNLKSLLAIIFS